jgi:hypothetical protein
LRPTVGFFRSLLTGETAVRTHKPPQVLQTSNLNRASQGATDLATQTPPPDQARDLTPPPVLRTSNLNRAGQSATDLATQNPRPDRARDLTPPTDQARDLTPPPDQARDLKPPPPRLQRSVERAARDPAERLPAALRDFLGARLKKWLPAVHIHQGPAADELTAALRADAVTFADRIVFRHRRYQHDRPESVALLGHELTHVAQAVLPTQRPRPADEELMAQSHESQLLQELSARKTNPLRGTAAEPPAVAPVARIASAAVGGPIRAAREDRPLPAPSQTDVAGLPERQLAQLREQMYRDLMQRLRTDFERGS